MYLPLPFSKTSPARLLPEGRDRRLDDDVAVVDDDALLDNDDDREVDMVTWKVEAD